MPHKSPQERAKELVAKLGSPQKVLETISKSPKDIELAKKSGLFQELQKLTASPTQNVGVDITKMDRKPSPTLSQNTPNIGGKALSKTEQEAILARERQRKELLERTKKELLDLSSKVSDIGSKLAILKQAKELGLDIQPTTSVEQAKSFIEKTKKQFEKQQGLAGQIGQQTELLPALSQLKGQDLLGLSKLFDVNKLEKEVQEAKELITSSLKPTERELQLQEEIDNLLNQADEEILNLEEERIPVGFIRGREALIKENINKEIAKRQRELERLQQQRLANVEIAKTRLGFAESEIGAIPKILKSIQPSTTETKIGEFINEQGEKVVALFDKATGKIRQVSLGKVKEKGEEEPITKATEIALKTGVVGLTPSQIQDLQFSENPPSWFLEEKFGTSDINEIRRQVSNQLQMNPTNELLQDIITREWQARRKQFTSGLKSSSKNTNEITDEEISNILNELDTSTFIK